MARMQWRWLYLACLLLLCLVAAAGTSIAPGVEVAAPPRGEEGAVEPPEPDDAAEDASAPGGDGPSEDGVTAVQAAAAEDAATDPPAEEDAAVPAVAGVPPAEEAPRSEQAGAPVEADDRPQLAIVIDDWGYGWAATDAFFAYPAPLTVAVIPGLPYSEVHAQRAREAGFDVLVHLPMEPLGGPEMVQPWGVTVDLDDEAIAEVVHAAFRELPWAIGMNNHMGSRATQDARVMRAVLEAVAVEGGFFLDSVTTAATVVGRVAADLGLAHLANRIFIDDVDDFDAVLRRLRQAAAIAEREGKAVAIGHVRPATAEALYAMLAEFEERGIELVPISAFAPPVERVLAHGVMRMASEDPGGTGETALEPAAEAAETAPGGTETGEEDVQCVEESHSASSRSSSRPAISRKLSKRSWKPWRTASAL